MVLTAEKREKVRDRREERTARQREENDKELFDEIPRGFNTQEWKNYFGKLIDDDVVGKIESFDRATAVLRKETVDDEMDGETANITFLKAIDDIFKRDITAGKGEDGTTIKPYADLLNRIYYDPGVVLKFLENTEKERARIVDEERKKLGENFDRGKIDRLLERIITFDSKPAMKEGMDEVLKSEEFREVAIKLNNKKLEEVVVLTSRIKIATESVDRDGTERGKESLEHVGSYYFNWREALEAVKRPIIKKIEDGKETMVYRNMDRFKEALAAIHATYMDIRHEHPEWLTYDNSFNERSQQLKDKIGGFRTSTPGNLNTILLELGKTNARVTAIEEGYDYIEGEIAALREEKAGKDHEHEGYITCEKVESDYITKAAAVEAIGTLEAKYDAELERQRKELEALKGLSEKYNTLEANQKAIEDAYRGLAVAHTVGLALAQKSREETAKAYGVRFAALEEALKGKADAHPHPYAPDSLVGKVEELKGKIDGKAPNAHGHDRYAPAVHTHPENATTVRVEELEGRVATVETALDGKTPVVNEIGGVYTERDHNEPETTHKHVDGAGEPARRTEETEALPGVVDEEPIKSVPAVPRSDAYRRETPVAASATSAPAPGSTPGKASEDRKVYIVEPLSSDNISNSNSSEGNKMPAQEFVDATKKTRNYQSTVELIADNARVHASMDRTPANTLFGADGLVDYSRLNDQARRDAFKGAVTHGLEEGVTSYFQAHFPQLLNGVDLPHVDHTALGHLALGLLGNTPQGFGTLIEKLKGKFGKEMYDKTVDDGIKMVTERLHAPAQAATIHDTDADRNSVITYIGKPAANFIQTEFKAEQMIDTLVRYLQMPGQQFNEWLEAQHAFYHTPAPAAGGAGAPGAAAGHGHH